MPDRDIPAISFMSGGLIFIFLMSFLRRRLLWWSLHPVAYPLASSWTMNWMWFPIFISWLIKRVLLKQGGLSAYRKAIPFFFGLILGEYFVGGGFNIYGILTHRYIYILALIFKTLLIIEENYLSNTFYFCKLLPPCILLDRIRG